MSSACAPNTTPSPTRFGIAFGSNLGDRLGQLSEARRRLLAASPTPGDALFSPVFESPPAGCPPGSGAFLNAVAEIALPVSPAGALALCQQIEHALGRAPGREKNAPRRIDLDLLYAGECRCDTATLQLPHPQLVRRRFVLVPLASIRPQLTPPGAAATVVELLQNLFSEEPQPRKVADHW